MTLSSGADKKSARTDGEPGYGGDPTRASVAYSGEEQDAAAPPAAPGEPSPKAVPGIDGGSGLLASMPDEMERLSAWLVPAAYAADNSPDERYLVRTGNISSVVEDFEIARKQVTTIARQFGGTLTNSNITQRGDGGFEGSLTLRVPNASFFDTWEELLRVGKPTAQAMDSQDVSGEYVTTVSQLKTLTAQHATLRKMFDEALAVQRKQGVKEGYDIVMQTEQRLTEVTQQMQSAEDRLHALADQITRSTITVNLQQRIKSEDLAAVTNQLDEPFRWNLDQTWATAVKDLKFSLRTFAQGLLYFLVTCWTWLIPWALFIYVGWRLFRRYLLPRLRAEAAQAAVLRQ